MDEIDDRIVGRDGVNYVLGWRVYVELCKKNDIVWWDHCVIVRPSYVIK